MSDDIDKAKEKIEEIALEVATMEKDDIPALGKICTFLDELEENAIKIDSPDFSNLIAGLKIYIEKVILREVDDFTPFEQGFEHLQAVHRCIYNRQKYKADLTGILDKLGFKPSDSENDKKDSSVKHEGIKIPVDSEIAKSCEINEDEEILPVDAHTETESMAQPENPSSTLDAGNDENKVLSDENIVEKGSEEEEFAPPDQDLDEEDREILAGFITESLENLEVIEVSLIDLEDNPGDSECINSIFRSFHTIKGVSGFLNLMRINKLAHKAENLLDKVRSGEIAVQGPIIDIILESVDLLKKLIEGVRDGMENGTPMDIGIDISPLTKRIDAIQIEADDIGDKPIGEILINQGAISEDDLEKGLEKQKQQPDKKLGQILVEEKKTDSKKVVSALRQQKKFAPRHMDLQVKVDTQKLDNLVNLTGELVIAHSMLKQNQSVLSASDQELYKTLGQLTQITSSLQTTAMSMRMVPIKSTFQKMVRLVRDLAKNSGKEVKLKMTGEDTEIDRNVVDELYEPMVHMVRNSVDHGIGTPEERKKEGKPKSGEVHLKAYHQGGRIIVEISDDGNGLDKAKIIEKAKASKLITDESRLSDTEIYNMIFQPGFSTAKKVTAISGRGVGMDVVKKGIEKLRGKVEINSQPGKGSTFIISLPLTLAIIEGMLVRVGKEKYVIPALSILESLRPTKEQYSTVEGKGEMILSRGKLMPLVRLSRIFNLNGDSAKPWESLVVVVEHENRQFGILLDELLGKEEVVIKSLGATMKDTKGITGGAIMGDGRVGLILDIAGIWDLAME